MHNVSLLAPAAVLILWSLAILMWMVVVRLNAFSAAGINLAESEPGVRYADIESTMPAKVNWLSHNYTHLMEQPTLFYAVIAVLTLADAGSGVNIAAAWGYVAIRMAHSLWQGLVNILTVRVGLFTASTLCLWVLAINAVRATVF